MGPTTGEHVFSVTGVWQQSGSASGSATTAWRTGGPGNLDLHHTILSLSSPAYYGDTHPYEQHRAGQDDITGNTRKRV